MVPVVTFRAFQADFNQVGMSFNGPVGEAGDTHLGPAIATEG